MEEVKTETLGTADIPVEENIGGQISSSGKAAQNQAPKQPRVMCPDCGSTNISVVRLM